ncbi:MAG: flagellar motor protein MotA, partial [Acidobacteriota bacterium]
MSESNGSNLVQLFLNAGPTAKAVLVVLAFFSLVSWAIIIGKIWSFSRAGASSRAFLAHFRKSRKFADVLGICDTCEPS